MSWEILDGDCLERLADLDDDSIDAVVTDPPYGLSAEPDAAEVLRHWLDGNDYQHRGGGFMGKTWDSFVPGPTVWKECLRVLKPGGHLVAFFGTRTVDLGGIAIRLAGFEIRDCLAWHYGSGFPKSLDVSRAMDKAAGAEREVVETKWRTPSNKPEFATKWGFGANTDGEYDLTAPATDLVREWQGWGTALKPAFEPIILARKPLIGTVAENVTRYGTGALNVDGCRVEHVDADDLAVSRAKNPGREDTVTSGTYGADRPQQSVNTSGRWPANLILDDQAAAMLDEQLGETTGRVGMTQRSSATQVYGDRAWVGADGGKGSTGRDGTEDRGGSSRFFYQAKASRAEREAGLAEREAGLAEREAGVGALRDSGRGKMAANHHPTVKPIDLMRWLVRLVTPPGGLVLDPFTGSGTTGIAAGLESFNFVGIEREAEYREIAEARLKWWGGQEGETIEILRRAGLAEKEREKAREAGQESLFDTEAA